MKHIVPHPDQLVSYLPQLAGFDRTVCPSLLIGIDVPSSGPVNQPNAELHAEVEANKGEQRLTENGGRRQKAPRR